MGRVRRREDLGRGIAGRLQGLAHEPAARESRLGLSENLRLAISLVVTTVSSRALID